MRPALLLTCPIVFTSILSASPCGAQPMDIRPCASISNPYERADCVRRSSAYQSQDGPASQAPRTAPSFDCRLARTSMERAICGDDELSGWDARMGQAYQQAIRTQRDPRALQDSQRNWISQRDRTCSSSPETTFQCLLDMTRQRATALAQVASTPAPSAPASSPAVNPPASNTPSLSSDVATRQAASSTNDVASTESKRSDDSVVKGFLFLLFLGALYAAVKIANAARRRRLLIAKYGEAIAARIIARDLWLGMTQEQLIESLGNPVEIGNEILRTKTKQVWKYGQTGKNRFRQRVTVENGIVSGWKN
jgi:uncharacterized protein YecT (DUF1311 family)